MQRYSLDKYLGPVYNECCSEEDRFTGALTVCSYCKPNAYQARILDYNQHWWWDLISVLANSLDEMYDALADRIANVAPPAQLKELYSSGSRSSTTSWSKGG